MGEHTNNRTVLLAASILALLMASGCATGIAEPPLASDQGQDAQVQQTPDSGAPIAFPDALVMVPDAAARDVYLSPVPDAATPDAYVVPGLPTAQQVVDAKRDTQPVGVYPGLCPDVVVSVGIQVLLGDGTWGTERGWTITNRSRGNVNVMVSTLPYIEYVGGPGCSYSSLGLNPVPGGGTATLSPSCIPSDVSNRPLPKGRGLARA